MGLRSGAARKAKVFFKVQEISDTLSFLKSTIKSQMKRLISGLLFTGLASSSFAQNNIAPPVSDVVRNCSYSGCQLTCTNPQGVITVKEATSSSIRTIMLSNGTTEFRLNDGYNGVRTIFVAKEYLICSITGEK
ncbi:hypothetical protein [Herbaspirillum lusitanum]|uniref:hypothetical protein n=1 Tax=Herbaspirillum lusitanum TaxID=213312 RepID=UPI0022390DF1|nr:hypothetical protein [Herbaspirillum lusitanum]